MQGSWLVGSEMGSVNEAKCNHCSAVFRIRLGGGIQWELLRCEACGRLREVDRRDWESLGPFGRCHGHRVLRDVVANEHGEMDEVIGRCPCGGRFTLSAAVRCPCCHSSDIETGKVIAYSD